jgi:hypothetical protein
MRENETFGGLYIAELVEGPEKLNNSSRFRRIKGICSTDTQLRSALVRTLLTLNSSVSGQQFVQHLRGAATGLIRRILL